jgi:hypothetical protein
MNLGLVVLARIWENILREFARNLRLSYENHARDRINYALASDGPNELQQCMLLGASYVQRVVHALNNHILDHQVFNGAKIFNPCHNPSNDNK